MSDIVEADYENNIKLEVPEEDGPVQRRSGGFWGLSRKGLLVILAMFLITAALALGVGLHFAAAHTRKRIPSDFRAEDLLSNYVQPL